MARVGDEDSGLEQVRPQVRWNEVARPVVVAIERGLKDLQRSRISDARGPVVELVVLLSKLALRT